MINLDEARNFIARSEQRSRELEVEKAKLEQKKEYTEKSLKENEEKMIKLNCTPETINDEIEKLSSSISNLRSVLETKLDGVSRG